MIELRHLRTLQALRHTGSLAAAAARLHQTQSALSHQFSDLEHRLGFALFIRKSQPLRFTPQGEILLQLADQVLPQVQQALHACKTPCATPLRLAIECHSCLQWLTPALATFRQRCPDVEVDFQSAATFDPQPALARGELDLVLTSETEPARAGLRYLPLFEYEMRLVLPVAHRLAHRAVITPHDLASETLLLYPLQRQRFDIWRRFLQPAGVEPVCKTVDNTLLMIQMVSVGMGITALPHWVVASFEKQGLVVSQRLADGLWSQLYGAVQQRDALPAPLQTFISVIKQHAAQHLPGVQPVTAPADRVG